MSLGSRLRRLDARVLGRSSEGETELEWLARLSRLSGRNALLAAMARQIISLDARVQELEWASGVEAPSSRT